jgi:hypothetical protein
MKPIRTTESNHTYHGPADDVADLPCQIDRQTTASTFQLSPEERELIAKGGFITLRLWGHPIPPSSLTVTDPETVKEAWEEDDLRCIGCGAVWRKSRGFETCNHCGDRLYPAAFDGSAAPPSEG